ncbi:hemicentin-1-like isoform X2 [Chelmon rostratus]|uniref:hemicentin-1-like isoform X2 n=1 Tax=Chelmon rostratus TaxID=109905 RepID=UPI001BEC9BE1|nr:hemicentin-1-like isoform X2 [Chelmon rostratus]
MFSVQATETTMKLLPVVCLCVLTWSETASADENGGLTSISCSTSPNGGMSVVVKEGRDVILPCSPSTNIVRELFDWKKDGQKEVFMYDAGLHYNNGRAGQDEQFKGRVSHFQGELKHGNASIIIRNTKVTDSGNYTCDFPRLQPRQTFHIRLVVGGILKDRRNEIQVAAPKPSVTTLHETKDWSLLQCEVHGASPKPKVEWQDSAGNVLHAEEPQVSERGGHFYITLNTTVTKTDRFRCVVTQQEINHKTYTETYVHINGAAPKPSVTILDETKDWSLLQCEVHGASPKPKVEWQDSAGNVLHAEEPQVSERGGHFYITLNTTVTKTGRFRCVATQQEINHKIYTEIYVHINDQTSTKVIIGVSVGVLCGIVVGVVVGFHLARSRNCCNKGSTQDKRDQTAGKESEPLDSSPAP